MGAIRPVDGAAQTWGRVGDLPRQPYYDTLTEEELDSRFVLHHQGSDDEPQLLEVQLGPHAVVNPHAHSRDEIIYVVAGELHLGRQVLGPGSSVYVGADTLYSFRAGPDGLRFANFRGRGGASFITKDEFVARRSAPKDS